MEARKLRSQSKKTVSAETYFEMSPMRFRVVILLFVLWMLVIGLRLFNLQTTQHDFLHAKATSQYFRERKTKPLRGTILDRQERELAVTLEVQSLAVDPTELENIEAGAYQLATVLNKDPKELLNSFNDSKAARKRFLLLERELTPETADKVKGLGIKKGLIWSNEQKRVYPNQNLAAHVIGFTNRENNGQAGVEAAQNENLRGNYTQITEERDGSGHVYELTEKVIQPPRNVVLTIDSAIQFRVEQALATGIAATNAKSGSAIVLDPATGEILAMANAPVFNPNNLGETNSEAWANRAIQNTYEPGSTFKLVTYSAVLEEGVANPNTQIDCRAGFIKVGKRQIKDSGRAGVYDLTKALALSSNVAAITLGQRLGKDRLYEYVRRFGYGTATGIELPTESRGFVYAPEKWNADSIGSVPIGYEVAVTALQSAAAFAAIANNGVRIAPHIVKEIREEDGQVIFRPEPEQRRVVSPETANTMRQMLAAVTEEGTAKRAQLVGYTTAGKTGTAHKFDSKIHGYAKNKYVASFVGFAPIEKPAVVIAVMIDEPRGAARHGGDVAAPIFHDIAEQILPELRIPADSLPEHGKESLLVKHTNVIELTTNEKLADEKVKISEKTVEKVKKPERGEDKDVRQNASKEKLGSEKLRTNEARERTVETKKQAVQVVSIKTKSPPASKTKPENQAKPTGKTKGKT